MATPKIRHLTHRPGRRVAAGAGNWGRERDRLTRFFWTPSPELRRAGWKQVRLAADAPAGKAKVEAIVAAEEWNAKVDAWRTGDEIDRPASRNPAEGRPDAIRPGTIDALIEDYKASRFFKQLRERTRRDYKYNFAIISEWTGDIPVPALSEKACNDYYEGMLAATPAKANAVMRVLRLLMGKAAILYSRTEPGYIRKDDNPAAGLGLVGTHATPLIWPEDAMRHFVATADATGYPSIGDAVLANYWLGQREGDVLAFPKSRYRNGVLRVTQSKRGARVDLPVDMVNEIAERFNNAYERHRKAKVTATTIIVCEMTGRPWNQDTFQKKFSKVRARAAKEMPLIGQPHLDDPQPFTSLIFRQLRHTAVVRLKEAECDNGLIHSITGHSLRSIDDILPIYLVATGDMARTAFAKRLEKEGKE